MLGYLWPVRTPLRDDGTARLTRPPHAHLDPRRRGSAALTRQDVWMAIEGKVYDITNFMDDHPGGSEVMHDHAGKDGTDA